MMQGKATGFDKRIASLISVFTVLAVLLAAILAMYSATPAKDRDSHTTLWSEGWSLSNEDGGDTITIPYRTKDQIFILKNTLPSDVDDLYSLFVHTDYKKVEVFIDGTLREQREKKLESAIYPQWTEIVLDAEDAGRTLELRISEGGSHFRANVYAVHLGNHGEIRSDLFQDDILRMAAVVVMIFIAILLIIVAASAAIGAKIFFESGFFRFSTFILLSAIWLFTDGKMQAVIAPGSYTILWLNIMAYLLLPLPLIQYIRDFYTKTRFATNILNAVFLLQFFIDIIMGVTGVLHLNMLLSISHGFLAVGMVVLTVISAYELFALKNRRALSAFLAILPLDIFGVTQLIVFYAREADSNTSFFAYGFVLTTIVLAYGLIKIAFVTLKSTKHFEELSETIPCGICRVSLLAEPQITYANDYYYYMLNITEDMLKKHPSLIFEKIIPSEDAAVLKSAMAKAKEGYGKIEVELRHNIGDTVRWMLVRGTYSEKKDYINVVVFDITDMKNADEVLHIKEEEYRIAAQQSDKMILRYDIKTKTCYFQPLACATFGVPGIMEDMPESLAATGAIAADSKQGLFEFFSQMDQGYPSGIVTAKILDRISGQFKWYHGDFTVVYDTKNQPVQSIVFFYDVTEQYEKELAFGKWQQSFNAYPSETINYYECNLTHDEFECENGSLFPTFHAYGTPTLFNLASWVASCVVDEDKKEFMDFYDKKRLLSCFERDVLTDKIIFRRKAEEPLWTSAEVQLLRDPFSSDVKCFILLRDVNAETIRENLATEDSLTKLLNRGAFIGKVNDVIEANEKTKHAFIMSDLDNFKAVNDVFGHQAGDEILLKVATMMKEAAKDSDLCGRIGGDEFVMFITGAESMKAVEAKINAIRETINGTAEMRGVTCSFGISMFPSDGHCFDELYANADKALYTVKKKGRNGLAFYRKPKQRIKQSPTDK